jgi:hypothetical protein
MSKDKFWDGLIKYGVWVVCALIGFIGGVPVGLEKAGKEFDQSLKALTAEHQAFKDKLPSENPTCFGKPFPCTMGLSPERKMLCATWLVEDGKVAKSYCVLPDVEVTPQIPKPTVLSPKIEPDVTT